MYIPPGVDRDLFRGILSVLSAIALMVGSVMLIAPTFPDFSAILFIASPFLGIKFAKLAVPRSTSSSVPEPIVFPEMRFVEDAPVEDAPVEDAPTETYLEKKRREAIAIEEAEAASELEPEVIEVVEEAPVESFNDEDEYARQVSAWENAGEWIGSLIVVLVAGWIFGAIFPPIGAILIIGSPLWASLLKNASKEHAERESKSNWEDDGPSAAGTAAKVAGAGLAVGLGSIIGSALEQSRKKDAAARRAYKRKWNKPMGGKPVRTPKPKPPKKPRTPNQARGDRKRSATVKKNNMNKKQRF